MPLCRFHSSATVVALCPSITFDRCHQCAGIMPPVPPGTPRWQAELPRFCAGACLRLWNAFHPSFRVS